MDFWEQRMVEFVRRGERSKVQFLDTLNKSILPVQLRRIRQNDKTVMKELVLPPWLDWDLLYEWSLHHAEPSKGKECILCNRNSEQGSFYNDKFICEECLLNVKSI